MQSKLDEQAIDSSTSLPEVEDLSSKVPDISAALAPVEVKNETQGEQYGYRMQAQDNFDLYSRRICPVCHDPACPWDQFYGY